MKKLFRLLKDYYREEFNPIAFLLCLVWAGVLTFFAYRNSFYESYIEDQSSVSLQVWRYCELYLLAFGGAFLLQGFAEKNLRFLRQPIWYVLMILAIGLFAFRGSDFDFAALFGPEKEGYHVLTQKLAYNSAGLYTLVLPCFIYWLIQDRGKQNFYGFKTKGVTLAPYFIMLAMMLPLLFWAGNQPDFLDTYPRYTKLDVADNHPHYWGLVALYELVYGSDFVFTEFFFRGFIILAFARHFGHRAVLPMCVYYVTIHYGKPLGETISSFFGGLLLGVIAYRSRSIYGGIIVHLGIAYLMEIFAFLGRSGYLHF